MSEIPSIQWFPGHMAKTRRQMKECLPLVDIIIELTDARIPASSRNPEIERLAAGKPRVVLLNKCDAADETATRAWCAYYTQRGVAVLPTDCRSGKGLAQFVPLVRGELRDELLRREKRGMAGKPIRMMIVGIPNAGKSSFINRMANAKRAKVEDRPGVTRGRQWVSLDGGLDLLDMPGVLWPKFDDPAVGERLAFTGAIKDDIMDIELLATRLLELLQQDYAAMLCARYGLSEEEIGTAEPYDLLCLVGKKRGMLIAGGEVNTERAAIMLLDEFRSGKIGRITLELPPKAGEEAKP